MTEDKLTKLISGCLKDDRSCQKQLYKQYYAYAMAICLRYCADRDEAAEVMNQGFLKVFKNLSKFDNQRPFKIWIGKIMSNTAIDHYRSTLRMVKSEDLEHAEHVSVGGLPDHKLHYNDLLGMIQRLPHAYRMVFNLFAIEGYSHDEIAGMLQISEGTSKSNLHKARQKLRYMIEQANKDTRGGLGSNTAFTPVVAINGTYINHQFITKNLW